jgi:hypothetical protein
VEGGDLARALELYQGDLLEGFFVAAAPEYEHWLERERSRLRSQAARARSWSSSGQKTARSESRRWKRRGAETAR